MFCALIILLLFFLIILLAPSGFFSGKDGGVARRFAGGLLRHHSEDEHIPGGLHRVGLPVCEQDHAARCQCENKQTHPGVVSSCFSLVLYFFFLTTLLKTPFCLTVPPPPSDFNLCCAREDRPDCLCSGCCSQAVRLLRGLL